ncbi:hypothetical protein ACLB2K_003996 [Fragaria x ananassa]
MCFTRGWEQFRNYHRVRGGDFLVFTYEGGVSFEVDFFDIEGVGRTEFEERNEQITDPDMVEMSSDDEDDDIDEEASEHETERHDVEGEGDEEVEATNGMSCIMTVGNSIPTIPRPFFERHVVQFKTDIMVVGPDGTERVIRTNKNNKSVRFGTGWGNLCSAYDIQPGDMLMMEVIGHKRYRLAITRPRV